jgi:AcrR family transcriptional regulator
MDILEATADLLVKQGMTAVTHRSVADAAGVSLSAIRYYYDTREALLIACLEHIEAERTAEAETIIDAARKEPPTDAQQAATLLLRLYYGPRLDDGTLAGTVAWIIACAHESEPLSLLLAQLREHVDRQLCELLDVCAYAQTPVELVAAVMDGSILTSTAERKSGIAALAIRDAAKILTLTTR